MTPFIIGSLGDRMYGFWILVGTFIGYYGLFDIGLSTAVSRYVARAIGQKDSKEINSIVNTSFFIYAGIAAVIILLSCGVAFISFPFLKTAGEIQLFRRVVFLLGVSVALQFPMKVFRGLVISHLRYDLSSAVSISKLIVINCLVFWAIYSGHGILAMTVITFLANAVEHVAFFLLARVLHPDLRMRLSFFKKEQVGLLFSYSIKSLIAQIADMLKYRVDNFVIALVLDLRLVTYYSVGVRFIDYFYQFIRNSVGLAKPIYSLYEGQGNHALLRERFLDITRFSTIVSLFIGSSLIFYGKPFIYRWMGPDFNSSYTVMLILACGWIFELMQSPTTGLLYGISKHHYFSIVNPIEGLINLGLSSVLARKYGIYGVALGTTIPMLFFRLVVLPLFVCRSITLPVSVYYVRTLFITSVKTTLPLAAYFYAAHFFVKPNYPSIVVSAVIQFALFCPLAWFFICTGKERDLLKSALQKKRISHGSAVTGTVSS
jgi:O-antigen/teichoic acid export membrane protein